MSLPPYADNCPIPGVTIVITCKGRLSHLRESVPRLLRQRTTLAFEIIVVDYGDPDCCFDWVVEQEHKQLRSIRVTDNVDEFNLSRARNCGASFARCSMLSFVDADALVAENWLSESVGPINSGTAVVAVPNWKIIAFGICTVKTSLFHKVRGFDESFRGWGYEDNDFMQRIEQYGAVFRYDSNLVEMINHAPELRMQFYSAKDFMVSRNENMDRLANRRGRVNPHGYGVGDMVHFATPADTEPAVQA